MANKQGKMADIHSFHRPVSSTTG
ncbi:Bcsmb1 [Botrytis cinerea B05.10]|uniref:Bcsmb1 n=1 Tax=Botryotinia fuckeliana (strain B05.10) TaxID=332648 RepID=A0A384J733_BOTFB|nr:Bcsmb1 [Botrytis cinerea B05.10]ATZ46349.1 Bcsmb1 [Botrytis cinerea B05.10]